MDGVRFLTCSRVGYWHCVGVGITACFVRDWDAWGGWYTRGIWGVGRWAG